MKRKVLLGLLILVLIVASACSKTVEKSGDNTNTIDASDAESKLEELPSHGEYVAEVDGRGISKEDFEKNVLERRYSYIVYYGEDYFEGDEADAREANIRYEVQENLANEQIYII